MPPPEGDPQGSPRPPATCRGGPWAHREGTTIGPHSGGSTPLDWIASPYGFAMTMVPATLRGGHPSLRAKRSNPGTIPS
ncbi:MAG: hypothetical protein LBT00_09285 [Spirochaetaceae bacterium]|nr:hypothetical protein [Spirochaetaceae bacterium]